MGERNGLEGLPDGALPAAEASGEPAGATRRRTPLADPPAQPQEPWLTDTGEGARSLTPVFEQGELLERCCGDRELAAEIVGGAESDAVAYLDELEQAVGAGDAPTVHAVAHRLKGMSSTLAAERVWHRAERLEEMGRDGQLDDAGALVETLRVEVRRFFRTAGGRLGE